MSYSLQIRRRLHWLADALAREERLEDEHVSLMSSADREARGRNEVRISRNLQRIAALRRELLGAIGEKNMLKRGLL